MPLIHIVGAARAAFEEANIAPSEIGSALRTCRRRRQQCRRCRALCEGAPALCEGRHRIRRADRAAGRAGRQRRRGRHPRHRHRSTSPDRATTSAISADGVFRSATIGSGARHRPCACCRKACLPSTGIHPSSPLTDAVHGRVQRRSARRGRIRPPCPARRFRPLCAEGLRIRRARRPGGNGICFKAAALTIDEALDVVVARGERQALPARWPGAALSTLARRAPPAAFRRSRGRRA